MRRLPYTPCKLYYDGIAVVEIGHYLKTPAGSAYLITDVRQHKTRAYRVNLKCLRWPANEIAEDKTIHPLHWYKRGKKRAAALGRLNAQTTRR